MKDAGEDFDQTGFELPLSPQVAPADAGQGELFGDDYTQPDAADSEPVFWPAEVGRPRQTTTSFKPTSRNHFEASLLDSERPEACLFAS